MTRLLYIHKQLVTQKFIPIVFVTVITNQIKVSGDKHMLATLKY